MAGVLLACGVPALAAEQAARPAPDWPLAGVQYQRWSYRVDFVGMPMQMPPREFSNCLDRDSASSCAFDDPKAACKQTTLERVGRTQKVRMDCPDTKGLATFEWAGDGASWSGTFQMEGNQVPPGVGMRISAKYLGPCTEKEVRRPHRGKGDVAPTKPNPNPNL